MHRGSGRRINVCVFVTLGILELWKHCFAARRFSFPILDPNQNLYACYWCPDHLIGSVKIRHIAPRILGVGTAAFGSWALRVPLRGPLRLRWVRLRLASLGDRPQDSRAGIAPSRGLGAAGPGLRPVPYAPTWRDRSSLSAPLARGHHSLGTLI